MTDPNRDPSGQPPQLPPAPPSPAPPAASKVRQNVAAAALLIAALAGLSIVLGLMALSGFGGTLTGEKGAGKFLVLVLGSRIDSKILTGIAAALGVGSAFVAGGGLSNKLYYGIVALAALGMVFSLLMIVLLADDQLAAALYNWAPERIADAESFRTAANWALGGTCLWLVGVLGVQVGLHGPGAGSPPPAAPPVRPPPLQGP